jgi:hypothetical protein
MKIAIPRMEFVAAVNSVRLAKKVRESLKIPLAGTRYFTDSPRSSGHAESRIWQVHEIHWS